MKIMPSRLKNWFKTAEFEFWSWIAKKERVKSTWEVKRVRHWTNSRVKNLKDQDEKMIVKTENFFKFRHSSTNIWFEECSKCDFVKRQTFEFLNSRNWWSHWNRNIRIKSPLTWFCERSQTWGKIWSLIFIEVRTFWISFWASELKSYPNIVFLSHKNFRNGLPVIWSSRIFDSKSSNWKLERFYYEIQEWKWFEDFHS